MKNMLRGLVPVSLIAGALVALLVGVATPSHAQPVPSVVGPYNLDLGAQITNVAQVPGTVNGASQANIDQSGVVCMFDMTGEAGSPSTTFSIQSYDAANAAWQTLVTSGAVTALNTPTTIVAYPGAVATSVPTGMVIAGLPVSRVWRVTETVTGGGTTVTGRIGCNLLK